MRKAILIQSRLSSSRFPKKMVQKLGDRTLVEYVYQRCLQSEIADQVIVITSTDTSDDELYNLCNEKNIPVCRGSLNDVLKRYIDCAVHAQATIVCRVCGDSPFVDMDAIDQGFKLFDSDKTLEYVSTENSLNGFMSEIIRVDVLQRIHSFQLNDSDKEHVTKYIRDNKEKFSTFLLNLDLCPIHLKNYTLTIDYENDLKIANFIINHLKCVSFKSSDIIEILNKIEG
ncbi:cytidylyltransferase domain-containing protein [Sulfuricurvum kujiense]|uniref:cytidylyltransferase domain-containing protein n=1 Tax=Sulfuricurvum kujiense TaxID=148813 RepID=UPI0002D4A5C2|nr:hypothetical protein [Sulfuricurvum kujiense]